MTWRNTEKNWLAKGSQWQYLIEQRGFEFFTFKLQTQFSKTSIFQVFCPYNTKYIVSCKSVYMYDVICAHITLTYTHMQTWTFMKEMCYCTSYHVHLCDSHISYSTLLHSATLISKWMLGATPNLTPHPTSALRPYCNSSPITQTSEI